MQMEIQQMYDKMHIPIYQSHKPTGYSWQQCVVKLVAAAEWVEHPKLETVTLTTFTKCSVATRMISEQNVASIHSETF